MKIKAEDILKDLEQAVKYWTPIHKCMEEDFEFALGKQWEDNDVSTLEQAGVKALTINKIRPIIKLITGIERQSKSDFVAFPEGEEDGLKADIATSLLKHIVKMSKSERKLSEQFKRGSIGGADYLEPYIDYTNDMINGEMKIRNINPLYVFPDPDAVEYDLSDGRYLIKFSPNLSKDQIVSLFPYKESVIDEIKNGKIDMSSISDSIKHTQGIDYPPLSKANETIDENKDKCYDLVEYQYKDYVKKYYVVDKVAGVVQEVQDKAGAESYAQTNPDAKVIIKKVPEMRLACYVGGEIISDELLWSYPRWKGYSLIPYFPEWLTIKLDNRELNIQGIVRSIRDLQIEYNKRRTQELRHLNSSINSGTLVPKGSLSEQEKEKVKKFGSSPGIFIEYDASVGKPEKIPPTPLSTAHAQLAIENAQDLKEASGVNPDLLANSDNDQSGRAILLKQKQGLVMIQEYLDNYSDTKKHLGRFLLSQLGEVYTVETAAKVVGEGFLQKYEEFKKPVLDASQMPVLGPNGELQTEVDPTMVGEIFNSVLNSTDLDKYDVSIGEGAYSETVKISNYMTLADMASKGIPVPPDVLVGESMLPQGTKQRIVASIEAMQMAAQQAPLIPAKPGKPQGDKNA